MRGRCADGELDSAAFDIDNTARPSWSSVCRLRDEDDRHFDVKDDHSPISGWNLQRWPAVARRVSDRWHRGLEIGALRIRIDGALGSRGLTLRASDTMNNVSTAQVDAPRSRNPASS